MRRLRSGRTRVTVVVGIVGVIALAGLVEPAVAAPTAFGNLNIKCVTPTTSPILVVRITNDDPIPVVNIGQTVNWVSITVPVETAGVELHPTPVNKSRWTETVEGADPATGLQRIVFQAEPQTSPFRLPGIPPGGTKGFQFQVDVPVTVLQSDGSRAARTGDMLGEFHASVSSDGGVTATEIGYRNDNPQSLTVKVSNTCS